MPGVDIIDQITAGTELGRICALTAIGARDLTECVGRYPELFPTQPFDAGMLSGIAMGAASSMPWFEPDQLRVAHRAALWVYAADWQIDYLAGSPQEVDRLVDTCLTVMAGSQPPADQALARFLAEIRDEVASASAYPALCVLWRDELSKTLNAMAKEWHWKAAYRADPTGHPLPTLDEYLANADNYGLSFVTVAHWIANGDPITHAHLPELIEASAGIQQLLRLINDLNTYERDLRWGDLNALQLVQSQAELDQRMATLIDRRRQLLTPLTAICPKEVDYLARGIGFVSGFHQNADFWGDL